jgi:glycosyltransferase involved in cell wall biosynthesis
VGVPCVATDVGDAKKIVGELGIVVPSEEPKMRADGLERMLQRLNKIDYLELRERIVRRFPLEANG